MDCSPTCKCTSFFTPSNCFVATLSLAAITAVVLAVLGFTGQAPFAEVGTIGSGIVLGTGVLLLLMSIVLFKALHPPHLPPHISPHQLLYPGDISSSELSDDSEQSFETTLYSSSDSSSVSGEA